MLARKIFILLVISAAIALAGCGRSTSKAAVTGVITHSHQMALPIGYVVTIQIMDTTKAPPGKMIAEQVIESHGEVIPMPFEVIYDPGKINLDHAYSVLVKIEDSTGLMLYTNTTNVPVITKGSPTQKIEVIVVLANE